MSEAIGVSLLSASTNRGAFALALNAVTYKIAAVDQWPELRRSPARIPSCLNVTIRCFSTCESLNSPDRWPFIAGYIGRTKCSLGAHQFQTRLCHGLCQGPAWRHPRL